MRAPNDNDLLRHCDHAYAGLAAICCVLIAVSLTLFFGDTVARWV